MKRDIQVFMVLMALMPFGIGLAQEPFEVRWFEHDNALSEEANDILFSFNPAPKELQRRVIRVHDPPARVCTPMYRKGWEELLLYACSNVLVARRFDGESPDERTRWMLADFCGEKLTVGLDRTATEESIPVLDKAFRQMWNAEFLPRTFQFSCHEIVGTLIRLRTKESMSTALSLLELSMSAKSTGQKQREETAAWVMTVTGGPERRYHDASPRVPLEDLPVAEYAREQVYSSLRKENSLEVTSGTNTWKTLFSGMDLAEWSLAVRDWVSDILEEEEATVMAKRLLDYYSPQLTNRLREPFQCPLRLQREHLAPSYRRAWEELLFRLSHLPRHAEKKEWEKRLWAITDIVCEAMSQTVNEKSLPILKEPWTCYYDRIIWGKSESERMASKMALESLLDTMIKMESPESFDAVLHQLNLVHSNEKVRGKDPPEGKAFLNSQMLYDRAYRFIRRRAAQEIIVDGLGTNAFWYACLEGIEMRDLAWPESRAFVTRAKSEVQTIWEEAQEISSLEAKKELMAQYGLADTGHSSYECIAFILLVVIATVALACLAVYWRRNVRRTAATMPTSDYRKTGDGSGGEP